MTEPLFSVVIPVYNVERYLPQCLDSVIAQTYKDIEIVCVNDCSPDGSAKILEDYARRDSRIKVITHAENKGLGGARNTGVENSGGGYIFFLDSDDWLEPDTFERLAVAAKEHGFPDLLLINYNTVDDNTGERKTSLITYHTEPYADKNLVEFGIQAGVISAWIKCAKRTLYNSFRFIEHCQAEDIPTFYLFCLAKDCLIVDGGFYNYRIGRAGSIITTTSDRMHHDVLQNTSRVLALLDGCDMDDSVRMHARQYFSDRVLGYGHIRGYFDGATLPQKRSVATWVKDILLGSSKVTEKQKRTLERTHGRTHLVLLCYTTFAVLLGLEGRIWQSARSIVRRAVKAVLPYGVVRLWQRRHGN